MVTISGTLLGLTDLTSRVNQIERDMGRAVEKAMARTALGGQSIVRGKARGRPGPRVITGDYNRSIVGDWSRGGDIVAAIIGSNAPQALRLEFGFHGPDALGRFYNQPPFPHFGPSVPEIGDLGVREVTAAVGGIF